MTVDKPSLKQLMEEEMSNEEKVKKQMLNDKVELKQSNPEKGDHLIRKNRKRMNKSRKSETCTSLIALDREICVSTI